METKSIEKLLESVEDYGKTSIELLTLKLADRSSEILSKLITYFILIVTFSFFLTLFSIGIAHWIGELLGAAHFGFLVVAAFYGFVGCICVLFLPRIINRIRNSIIAQMLN